MPFDRTDLEQVQRLADIVNNDDTEYNIGLDFATQEDKEIRDAINLERSPLLRNGVPIVVGQDFVTGPELLAALDGDNVSNQSGHQAWLGFIGSILVFDGRLRVGNTAIRDSLKSTLDAAGATIVDGLSTKDPASIADAEFGVGTVLHHQDVGTARLL